MTVQTVLSTDFDLLARLAEPAVRRDPYPLLHWLRRHDPVHRTSAGFYLLTRHADVMWTQHRTGEVFLGPNREQLATQYPEAERHRSQLMFLNSLVLQDPPEHTRLRRSVTAALRSIGVKALLPAINRICERLLDTIAEPLHDHEVVDLHTQLSMPMSATVFAELLGIPSADVDWLAGLTADLHTATQPLADESVASLEVRYSVADACTAELTDYLEELFEQRRRSPRDDLTSALVASRDTTVEQLDDDELTAMVWVLWIAGVEAAAGGIDQGLRAALIHRDQSHWLRGTPDDVGAFGEEALRLYASPLAAAVVRIATRDVRYGDVTVPAGSDVRVCIAAANRDPEVFADPDRFDPSRSQQSALTWGRGMRHCLGIHLARAEMRAALPQCLARFPDLVPAGEPVWHDGAAGRTLHSLPVRLGV